MIDTYHSEYCPKCNSKNFWEDIYVSGDLSGQDVVGLICWKCEHEWLLEDSKEIGLTLDDGIIADGKDKVK